MDKMRRAEICETYSQLHHSGQQPQRPTFNAVVLAHDTILFSVFVGHGIVVNQSQDCLS